MAEKERKAVENSGTPLDSARFNPNVERIKIKQVIGGKEFEIPYQKNRNPVSHAEYDEIRRSGDEEKELLYGGVPEFKPSTYIVEGEPEIICDRDVACKLRDGVTIYADIYRPVGETNIPAIVSWSPFGKRPNDGKAEFMLMGVIPGTVSTLGKFESPDPAYWCRKGYAVANVDSRGVEFSEGNIPSFGTQDGRDGYDFVEWLAQQWWCNGKIGLAGNSGVAMTQWLIAAENPPHLACIAPWEGTSDLYRESVTYGGVPSPEFQLFIQNSFIGPGYAEDMYQMCFDHPLMDEYWEDKIPKFKNITCPAYITACWNHFHLRGSIMGWRKIKSSKKWLRAHRDFEWPDAYNPVNIADLTLFYDRYLKGIRNGWEMTPKVRIEVMDAYDVDFMSNRPEKEFPIKRTVYKKLYLDAANKAMNLEVPYEKESEIAYQSTDGEAVFDYTFTEDTELTGYMMARLYCEARGNDDMDLFITVMKYDTEGNWIPVSVLDEPHPGTWGNLRVSHRALDPKQSTKYCPVQSHLAEEKLAPGEIVPCDIEIMPSSRIWHKGEVLRLRVCGRYIREGWFEPLVWTTNAKEGDFHVLHTGGQYDSYLQIPVIPPKYVSPGGNYICR